MDLLTLEILLEQKICQVATKADPSHDILHFKRVVNMAKKICRAENGRPEVVIPAAWLHDLVNVPKNHPDRKRASRLSAEAAIQFLREIGYDSQYFGDIAHAIEAHSFSANITPRTLEAKIVQDADRLDGIGAIGVARCFATAGLMGRALYSENDPTCTSRTPDDTLFTVDHFFAKLFKITETLQTETSRQEGRRRLEMMRAFLNELYREISST